MRRKPKGYRIADFEVLLARFRQPNLAVMVALAISDWLIILAAATACEVLGRCSLRWPTVLLVNAISLVIIALRQRGLECLVHEASHFNFSRNQRLNDYLGDFLAAIPVVSSTAAFRFWHYRHHSHYGAEDDPDRLRYASLRFSDLDRTSLTSFVSGVVSRLPKYTLGWLSAIGVSATTVANTLAWHAIVLIFPLVVIFGAASALEMWFLYWLTPFTFMGLLQIVWCDLASF